MAAAGGEPRLSRREHWDTVYERESPDRVSWYQVEPTLSLQLIRATGLGHDARILDVGGGTSVLVDHLLREGFKDIGVLDVSARALRASRERLGNAGADIEWIRTDVLDYRPVRGWDVWHDRAVFHFLVDPEERARYRAALDRAVPVDGQVVVATFGPDGPSRCSGLETLQCSGEDIARELGAGVQLLETRTEYHRTPSGAEQQFVYARLQRVAPSEHAP